MGGVKTYRTLERGRGGARLPRRLGLLTSKVAIFYRISLGSGKVFASQERVSGFPEKGLTSGEVRGTSGEVWETSGEPLDCCKVPQRENFRGSRRKTSGEVWGTSGEVRGLPRSSLGGPDSLPATRQICLQLEGVNFRGPWKSKILHPPPLIFGDFTPPLPVSNREACRRRR